MFLKIRLLVIYLILFNANACKSINHPGNDANLSGTTPACLPSPSKASGSADLNALLSKVNNNSHVNLDSLGINRQIRTFSKREFDDVFSKLNDPNVESAFEYWFKGGYTEINARQSKEGMRNWDLLNKGYQAMKAKYPNAFENYSTVYRGLKMTPDSMKQLLNTYLSPSTRSNPVFLGRNNTQVWASSSRRPIIARDFAAKGEYSVVMQIKQKSGIAIESLSTNTGFSHEKEVLLPPSAKFKVTSIHPLEGNGARNQYLVVMEEVGGASLHLLDDEEVTNTPELGLIDDQGDQDDPILKYFVFDQVAPNDDESGTLTELAPNSVPSPNTGLNLAGSSPNSFALTGSSVCTDQRLKENVIKQFNQVDEAAKKVKAAQAAYNNAPNEEAQRAARASLRAAQTEATNATKSLAPYIKSVKVIRASGALKLVPVLGYMAEGAALGMGIAEAVQFKQNGGSDSAAAAAVLSGYGIAGAIPAILACENCTPEEKAAAFFSGFFGIDFSSLVICPGQRCPKDDDLAGFDGDWSMNRIKRSCPRGVPAVGTSHGEVEINLICSGLKPLPVTNYRFVDNSKWESRWSYDLKCEQNEYVAGISFLTSRGAPTYGIKSILCATRMGNFSNTCSEVAAESCPGHQFLRGIFLDRAHRSKGNIGTLCSKAVGQGRDDDQFEYCDHIKSVWCCNIVPW